MKLITTVSELSQALQPLWQKGIQLGFVPTMGALHEGHLSLVDRAARENEKVVVSIFVNPSQFNDPEDLKNYPRTIERDMQLLSGVRCDCLFYPPAEEVYPEPDSRQFNFGVLEQVMEGRFRPGHFNGVAQVVSRLFDIVKPSKAYFGLKDFQQYSIIRSMTSRLGLPVEIVPCRTVREADGLAKSSRNALLSPEHREAAPLIYQALLEARAGASLYSPAEVKRRALERINTNPLLQAEYFEIVDDTTLQPVTEWPSAGKVVACTAVFAGKIRLIDNIEFD